MKKKKKDNYIERIPVREARYKWDVNDKDEVTIYIENKGPFNFMAQKLLKKPRVSQIHLQGQGNYIWPLIDGERTIYDIGLLVKERFGDEAEPLFPRLIEFMKMLEAYGFIKIRKKEDQ